MDARSKLLEHAARRWEIDQALARAMQESEAQHVAQTPVITISRERGSGGRSVGKLLANELHYAYYDRELIEQIAAESNADADHVERYETLGRSPLGNILLSFMDRRAIQDTVYLRSLLRVLRDIAARGHAIIIGRGGACALPDTLRVRFIAPFEVRVERTAIAYSLTAEQARLKVLEGDHAQERFVREFFGCQPGDPHLYDLVINTGSLSMEHAAQLVITRLHQTFEKEGT